MNTYEVRVKYEDAEDTIKCIDAKNFIDACQKIWYNEVVNKIMGFEHLSTF